MSAKKLIKHFAEKSFMFAQRPKWDASKNTKKKFSSNISLIFINNNEKKNIRFFFSFQDFLYTKIS